MGTTEGPHTWICGQQGEFTIAKDEDTHISDAVMIAAKPSPERTSRLTIYRLLMNK